jgi:hypothetical protein
MASRSTRVELGFVVQGGCPRGDGNGGERVMVRRSCVRDRTAQYIQEASACPEMTIWNRAGVSSS